MPTSKTSRVKSPVQPTGFDITATVGRVEFGGDGDAFLAAFQVIGESAREQSLGSERTFSFDPSGMESEFMQVTVKMPLPPTDKNVSDFSYGESMEAESF